jgi:RimJ/RimL family protein N-acetyltransferase
MDIAIRETVEADLPEIFRIRTDPLVRPHQYKLGRRDTIRLWTQYLFDEQKDGRLNFRCATIVRHYETIGHISQVHYKLYGRKVCYCGWNLAPLYWGQGIAVIALTQLFDSLFYDERIDLVISDCFSDNRRGIRVLQKLNYEPAGIAPYERLRILVFHRCLHWILRFHLTADTWYRRTLMPGD